MQLQRIECSAIHCRPKSNPARIVIGSLNGAYCTFLEVLPPNEEPWQAAVHQGMTFDEALHDYQKRIEWLIGKPRKGV